MTVTQTIKTKAAKGKPLTLRQKLAVLTQTRSLISDEDNWLQEEWHEVINDVEKFCLYGAIHRVTGLDSLSGSDADEHISACSLTRTMFEALSDENIWKQQALKKIAQDEAAKERHEAWMVNALQNVNDNQDHDSVLRVLDGAIASLQEQING